MRPPTSASTRVPDNKHGQSFTFVVSLAWKSSGDCPYFMLCIPCERTIPYNFLFQSLTQRYWFRATMCVHTRARLCAITDIIYCTRHVILLSSLCPFKERVWACRFARWFFVFSSYQNLHSPKIFNDIFYFSGVGNWFNTLGLWSAKRRPGIEYHTMDRAPCGRIRRIWTDWRKLDWSKCETFGRRKIG